MSDDPVDSAAPGRSEQTRRLEFIRSCCSGPVQAAAMGSGVLQVVALQYFEAEGWQKALLAGALHAGLLATPLVMALVAGLGMPAGRGMALLLWVAAGGLGLAASATSLPVFLIGVLCGIPCFAAIAPLVTALWRENVPSQRRGRLFARVGLAGSLAALIGSSLAAWWLGADAGRFRPILVVLVSLLVLAGLAAWRLPHTRVPAVGPNPLACLSLLWKRPLFGYISFAWMLIGLGNLATLPLRTEFAGSVEHGLGYSAGTVLLLTSVLPLICSLPAMLVWGRLFDRLNFLVLRILINLFFGVSIVTFFIPGLPWQICGAICFGIGVGGGTVAWNLWVTKYAPPDETAQYMTVHTFLTGLRGLFGPQLAFAAIGGMSIQAVAGIGAGLVFLASILLLPVLRYGRSSSD